MRKTLLFIFLSTLILNSSCSKDEEELDVAGFYVADASKTYIAIKYHKVKNKQNK